MNPIYWFSPETAHRLALRFVQLGLHRPWKREFRSDSQPIRCGGVTFSGRMGLAAGFDKGCEWIAYLADFGFAFAEIGTVTPQPQPGNPRPRIFRFLKEKEIFNRMGFNSEGVEVVARRLERFRPSLPFGFRVGANLGKNKTTSNASAHEDYRILAARLKGLCDFYVVNVSSPNTPELRALQSKEALIQIVDAIRSEDRKTPIWIKIAPEFEPYSNRELITALEDSSRVQAWVISNTLGGEFRGQQGGWSGSKLVELSRERLKEWRQVSVVDLVSSGGILTPEEAAARIEIGASLVEVYTGWIVGGPRWPMRVRAALERKKG